MKKFLFFLTMVAIFTACKDEDVYFPGQNEPNYEYVWPGSPVPKPVEAMGKTAASGWTNVYDYSFRMHLDGSQIDPNPLVDINSFAIPHVGPGGALIYSNVTNDATYTITRIEGDWIYYNIQSQAGNTLKYNLAKKTGISSYMWFLRHGLTFDDGINNMVTFVAD